VSVFNIECFLRLGFAGTVEKNAVDENAPPTVVDALGYTHALCRKCLVCAGESRLQKFKVVILECGLPLPPRSELQGPPDAPLPHLWPLYPTNGPPLVCNLDSRWRAGVAKLAIYLDLDPCFPLFFLLNRHMWLCCGFDCCGFRIFRIKYFRRDALLTIFLLRCITIHPTRSRILLYPASPWSMFPCIRSMDDYSLPSSHKPLSPLLACH
jgi:hypothetical protein